MALPLTTLLRVFLILSTLTLFNISPPRDSRKLTAMPVLIAVVGVNYITAVSLVSLLDVEYNCRMGLPERVWEKTEKEPQQSLILLLD